jgi:hypothetical protein
MVDEGVADWEELEPMELEPHPAMAAVASRATAQAEGRRIVNHGS